MTQQELIDEVMDNFNFGKVLKVLQTLNWKWATDYGTCEVPEHESEVRKRARYVMKEAFKSGFCATAGFEAEYDREYNTLSLKFVVERWDAYEDD